MNRQSPLVIYPDKGVVLPSLLFPAVEYYAVMAAYGNVVIDTSIPYDKRRKDAHRFDIADTRGRLSLTVPIAKPQFSMRPTWGDVSVSEHGEWWGKHLTALESAYGRTPYFEFYIDTFKPFFSRVTPQKFGNVLSLNRVANAAVCSILGINEPLYATSVPDGYKDNRENRFEPASPVVYHQVRQDSLGFISGLSILDLIFNLGPESPLYLRHLQKVPQE